MSKKSEDMQLLLSHIELTPKQKKYYDVMLKANTKVVMLSGPAGTAKSFLSVYAALNLFCQDRKRKINYIRTVVESAERSMGYLKGSEEDKFNNYASVLYDKLYEILNEKELKYMTDLNVIKASPINFIRGQDWKNMIVICDECLAEGTYIECLNKKKRIEEIRIGEFVQSYNEITRKFEFKEVTNVWRKGVKSTITLKFGKKIIKCTPEHKFLTINGWEYAKDLKLGSILISNIKPFFRAKITGKEMDENPSTVFDIEVKDNHNFIVIPNGFESNNYGIVAHNCQNFSFRELTTVLTRINHNTKVFLCGDTFQSDIKNSGFESMCELFNDEESKKEGIHVLEFDRSDIMREGVVGYILQKIEGRKSC